MTVQLPMMRLLLLNTGTVTEESQLHTSGTLTVTDVDTGEAHFLQHRYCGALGTLHLTDYWWLDLRP